MGDRLYNKRPACARYSFYGASDKFQTNGAIFCITVRGVCAGQVMQEIQQLVLVCELGHSVAICCVCVNICCDLESVSCKWGFRLNSGYSIQNLPSKKGHL